MEESVSVTPHEKDSQDNEVPKVENSCTVLPGNLHIIVDDINEKVVVSDRGRGKENHYTRNDVVGRGIVTWNLLVDFARCNGSLEGNTQSEVKNRNTSVNRINLGEKLRGALSLAESPILKGRTGVMAFGSITLAGSGRPIDAMNRKTVSLDEQATELLARHGDDMPVP